MQRGKVGSMISCAAVFAGSLMGWGPDVWAAETSASSSSPGHQSQSQTLPPITVTAPKVQKDVDQGVTPKDYDVQTLPPITVTAPKVQKDYGASNDSVGLRVPASFMEVPQSVGVVPESILERQGAIFPNQALRNISGVSAAQPAYSQFQRYMIRGFAANNYLTDGLPDVGLDRTHWLGNIERIEVLKGPASVLYGGGDPGGTINYVTKKPSEQRQLHALASLGTYNYRDLLVDTTGPVNASRSVTYRVIAELQGSDSFIDRFKNRGDFLSAALHAALTTDTALDLQLQLRRRDEKVPRRFVWKGCCDNGSWSEPVDMWARRRGRLVHMSIGSGLI